MNSKRVAIYARVSTNNQDCQNQLIELRRYCQAREWEAVEYVDTGLSGALGEEKRPALKSLMVAVKRRQVNAVVVWDFSRFARSMRHLVEALDLFQSLGVSFISIREGIDTNTANGRMVFGIFASLSQFERELIRERVMLGLQKSRSLGRVPGPHRNAVDVTRLKEMASKGSSLRCLAQTFGVSKDTVRRLLRPAVANGGQNLAIPSVGVPA